MTADTPQFGPPRPLHLWGYTELPARPGRELILRALESARWRIKGSFDKTKDTKAVYHRDKCVEWRW